MLCSASAHRPLILRAPRPQILFSFPLHLITNESLAALPAVWKCLVDMPADTRDPGIEEFSRVLVAHMKQLRVDSSEPSAETPVAGSVINQFLLPCAQRSVVVHEQLILLIAALHETMPDEALLAILRVTTTLGACTPASSSVSAHARAIWPPPSAPLPLTPQPRAQLSEAYLELVERMQLRIYRTRKFAFLLCYCAIDEAVFMQSIGTGVVPRS